MFDRALLSAFAWLVLGAMPGCSASHTDDLPREPRLHRPTAIACDDVRAPGTTPDSGPPADCLTDAECTEGDNGRCTGNGHDGWRCTYDRCFADDGCGSSDVCACGGGFRSDANVCLSGDCRTDADCGPRGFCSPSLGSCGSYGGVVGWFCHASDDECIDDEDCPDGDGTIFSSTGYCAFDPIASRFRCSTMQCAG